jgi:hypothetical protein
MEKQVLGYKVLTSDNIEDLEEYVNKELDNSWIPQGGLTVIRIKSKGKYPYRYCQPMIQVSYK